MAGGADAARTESLLRARLHRHRRRHDCSLSRPRWLDPPLDVAG
jgi:hypothetical protein